MFYTRYCKYTAKNALRDPLQIVFASCIKNLQNLIIFKTNIRLNHQNLRIEILCFLIKKKPKL